ncbi:Glutamate receptor ionotropic, kainate 2 [Trichoplax sp. H2]|nr:Glutamate receptor ionotropic, kainate 2 [Trichoplax sp. H2]|eukprot:RDD37362.1 Glutamate receptor ionotropic, kainate 2 [Trichoplax sp. H2]
MKSLVIANLVFLQIIIFNRYGDAQEIYKFGLITPPQFPELERAINMTMAMINNKEIASLQLGNVKLSGIFRSADIFSPYDNLRKACEIMSQGIVTLIGPLSSSATKGVQNICSPLQMPQIAPVATDPSLSSNFNYNYLLRIIAPDNFQSTAIASIVERYKWTKMSILASSTDFGINALTEFRQIASRKLWRILSFELYAIQNNSYVADIEGYLQRIKSAGSKVVILGCEGEHATQIFEAANRLGLLSRGWAWIVVDTVPSLYPTLPSYTNGIISLRYYQTETSILRSIRARYKQLYNKELQVLHYRYIDALLAFGYGIKNMKQKGITIIPTSLNCSSNPTQPWTNGAKMLQLIKESSGESTSSPINFTALGGPTYKIWDVVNLHGTTWSTVGNFTVPNQLNLDGNSIYFMDGARIIADSGSFLKGKTIVVTTIIEPPFTMIEDNPATGRNYKGYIIDMMDKLASSLNFNYTVRLVADGQYGAQTMVDGAPQWSGMVGEVERRVADIAAAPLSISPVRQQVVDFSMPYIDQGLTVLTLKTSGQTPSLFQAFLPLTGEVWLCILLSITLVAIAVTFINRFSPFDHYGKACKQIQPLYNSNQTGVSDKDYATWMIENEEDIEAFSLYNSLWYTLESFLLQGADRTPRSFSARLITAVWWLASVIITSTYTANLAAFLTVNRLQPTITSLAELSKTSAINYGVLGNSSAETFFQQSTISPYIDMKHKLKNVQSTTDGINRVVNSFQGEKYAFIGDASLLNYAKSQNCNLTTIGSFKKDSYALILSKESLFLKEINIEIFKLREEGFFEATRVKWFEATCTTTTKTTTYDPVKLESLIGVFYIIMASIGMSIVILAIEWTIAGIQDSHRRNVKVKNFSDAIRQRFRFVINNIAKDLSSRRNVEADTKQSKKGSNKIGVMV